jgi:hypothetical protein
MKAPTNTERLIKSLEFAVENGHRTVDFMVGKYTGNGPSVVAALRARGYKVDRRIGGYTLRSGAAVKIN